MISTRINKPSSADLLEANLARLQARMPDAPLTGILLTRLIIQLGRDLVSMLEHQIRPFGLVEAEFRVLTTLYAQPDGSGHPGDLCVRAAQSPANMSRIADALAERGLITRVLSAQDRRRMVLRITGSGEDLVRTLLPTLWEPLRELLSGFPEGEQRALSEQLKRLGATLEDVVMHPSLEREP